MTSRSAKFPGKFPGKFLGKFTAMITGSAFGLGLGVYGAGEVVTYCLRCIFP